MCGALSYAACICPEVRAIRAEMREVVGDTHTQMTHYIGDSCLGGHREEGKKAGLKFDEGKLRYELVPPSSLRELVQVYTDGARKYGAENYMKGLSWKRVIAALMRHVEAYRSGESWDTESGSPHLAHAAWACFTLMVYEELELGEDDRVFRKEEVDDDKQEAE